MATRTLTFTGTNAALDRVIDLNAQYYGYQPTINGEANPESKEEFLRKVIRGLLISRANLQERDNAVAALVVPPVNGIT